MSGRAPVVTYTLIALCVIVFIAQNLPGNIGTLVHIFGVYRPAYTEQLPWTMISSAFLHGGLVHLGLNMISLFLFGPIIERLVGKVRFLVLYLVSAFGGSVAVLLLAPGSSVLGASGAIFGLMGAFFIIQRRLGANSTYLVVLIGINLVYGFLPGTNISWQAHIGGLVAGAAVAFVYLKTRRADQKVLQIALVGAVVAALLALTLVGVALA